MDTSKLNFDQNGLIPAILQDADTLQVLMLGWMNMEAIRQSQETGLVTFWSRSRQKMWTKGESSRNYLYLQAMFIDCDQDAILIHAKPAGPTCHTGNVSCFYTKVD